MNHRIFIGLQLPRSFHQTLADWRMQHAEWPVRWTRSSDLHLTIVPPWEVESVASVNQTFNSLNGFFQPQTITFNSIQFLHPDAARMLWVEGSANSELLDMKQRLHTVFARPAEEQPFRPHVTLARCWPDEVTQIKTNLETVTWPVHFETLVLYESCRDQFGSRYKVLGTIAA